MPKQVLEALVKSFSEQFLNQLLPEEETCCHSGADFMFKLPEKTDRQSSVKFDCEEGSDWKWKVATQRWGDGIQVD